MPPIPNLLEEMIANGKWPNSNQGWVKSPALRESVRRLAPEEDEVFLCPPPFRTVRELSLSNDFWNWPASDPTGIDFDLAILIGDFGPGTDAPILLDFRRTVESPRVVRLRWLQGHPNEWIVLADSFASFVNALGL